MMCYKNVRLGLFLLLLFFCANRSAAMGGQKKLSAWLRQIAIEEVQSQRLKVKGQPRVREVCAFVRMKDDGNGEKVLCDYGCTPLAQQGSIWIANIPTRQLSQLAADERIVRIEARQMGELMLDSMRTYINYGAAHEGQQLPQAFRGNGVVVGVMDIGFDVGHPNFFTSNGTDYRIKCMWDMLSVDTLDSKMPVGRDFIGTDALLAVQHSRDGLDFTHGTYTLGIAAGGGAGSKYVGVAPESDICVVANAVSNNKDYIDSLQSYKFTDAMNALGFKYMFDYAESVGKPCVLSLSEGGYQDFWGEDQLYSEMLQSLVGPGRIIVSAAGNRGYTKTWMKKERGQMSKGTFLHAGKTMMSTAKSADDFELRIVFYNESQNDTVLVSTREVKACQDSVYVCYPPGIDSLLIQAYPSCYNSEETCYDVVFCNNHSIGMHYPLSLELVGREADVELWSYNAILNNNDLNPLLNGAENSHNICSPSSFPCVICVGATTYRTSIINHKGDTCVFIDGDYGRRAMMSSTGPTTDGRIKPDVMAPGINVISSYSSYYIAQHPTAEDAAYNLYYYDYGGRTYTWNCNSGTSGSAPAVAGSIALWLQANPKLTPAEVLDVIARTSRHNDPSLTYPNNEYGYGEIDVYRGLLDILKVDKIEQVSPMPTAANIKVEGNTLSLQFPELLPQSMQLTIYQLTGTMLTRQVIPASCRSYTVDIPQLKKDVVYVVQMSGYQPYAGSMLIRP